MYNVFIDLAGSAGVLFGHPLDTVKCQLQVQQAGNQYKGLLDCCVTISKQGLVRSVSFATFLADKVWFFIILNTSYFKDFPCLF